MLGHVWKVGRPVRNGEQRLRCARGWVWKSCWLGGWLQEGLCQWTVRLSFRIAPVQLTRQIGQIGTGGGGPVPAAQPSFRRRHGRIWICCACDDGSVR